jgi:dienelactone hydrolase
MRCRGLLAAVIILAGSRVDGAAVAETRAPAGTVTLAVRWVRIDDPGGRTLLAAVARPPGRGPFPAIVLLHGTHGFAREYVQLALDLARGGVVAVAPCWFAPGSGAGLRYVTPIACPEAPPVPNASDPAAQQTVDALVRAVRTLPDVRPDRIALFGHSRGGGAALTYALARSEVQAVVLNSGGYPDWVTARAGELKAPVLILHGALDGPPQGGTGVTSPGMARAFAAAAHHAGKPVELQIYERGEHNSIFADRRQHDDEIRRIKAFLARTLRR